MLNSEYSPDWYVDLHTVSFIVTHEVYKGGGGGGGAGGGGRRWGSLASQDLPSRYAPDVEDGRKFLRDHIVDIV